MTWYIARRIAAMIPVFLGATLLIYGMVFLLPGDPIAEPGGGRTTARAISPQRPVLVAVPALPRWHPARRPRSRLLRSTGDQRSGAGVPGDVQVGNDRTGGGGAVRRRVRGHGRVAPGWRFRRRCIDRQPDHNRGADLRTGVPRAIRLRGPAGYRGGDGRRPADVRPAAIARNRPGRRVIRVRGAVDPLRGGRQCARRLRAYRHR